MSNPVQRLFHKVLPIRKFKVELDVISVDQSGQQIRTEGKITAIESGKTLAQAMVKAEKKFIIRATGGSRIKK